MKDANGPEKDTPRVGKRYSAPRLTEYGSVAKLTMLKGGSFAEVPSGKKTTSCL